MKTKIIWQVSLESGGYGGISGLTEEIERKILNCDRDFNLWNQLKKRLFFYRKDAEDYIRPIAQQAFKSLISNLKYNEENNIIITEYKKRGIQEIRTEKLTPNSPYYKRYNTKEPSTTYVCPIKQEYDRIGYYFAIITPVRIY